jgi:prepilin-type N-terminal cleavage/methylation domain-containing protein
VIAMNDSGASEKRRIDRRRGGFSLVELLMAVSIVGILTGLAIPNLRTMQFRARAAEVAGDLDVVRVATVSYNADVHQWPADATAGTVPTELTNYLPANFSFAGNGYELKFENYALPGGLPFDPQTTQIVAVSVAADSEGLSNAIQELLGGSIIASVGTTHTVLIDRS